MKTKQAAKKLERMGTDGDTILAHINPEEAAVLKAGGGSGKRNPRTGLLSFGGYEGGGTDFGGPEPGEGAGNFNESAFGGGGKPGESNMAQAAATRPDMTPEAYAALQRDMISAMGPQDAGLFNSLLTGIFGPLGTAAGKMGLGDYLSQAWNEKSVMNTPYGSPAPGGLFGGFGGSGDYGNSESGMGDGSAGANAAAGGGLLGGLPAAPAVPTYARPAFVSKFGRPRGLLSTGAQLTGFRGY